MERKQAKGLINNPFPGEPSGLEFVEGTLFFNPTTIPTQSWSVGNGFEIRWNANFGGALSVFHHEDPTKNLWSTVPGVGFVSAASGSCTAWESRGSFALHDDIEIVLPHQTIEAIEFALPHKREDGSLSLQMQSFKDAQTNPFFSVDDPIICSKHTDGDGVEAEIQGNALIITGLLHTNKDLAAQSFTILNQPLHIVNASFINPSQPKFQRLAAKCPKIVARYWLIFAEKRDHHLCFSLKLDRPTSYDHITKKYAVTFGTPNKLKLLDDHGLEKGHWLWSNQPLSAFSSSKSFITLRHPNITRSIIHCDFKSICGNTRVAPSTRGYEDKQETQILCLTEQKLPQLNRAQITYWFEKDEKFFGFGEQFSYFDMKGRKVPILVQEQGLGRGDQPITALANLVSHRSGGCWHTTYAPSPYYMTSKMRSLFLETYDFCVFDLRQQDKVQVQVHAGSLHGRILHGANPCEILKRYTDAIGRMRELPAWILKGAVVGMQGGTESVKKVWKLLQGWDVPIAAFWLQDWVGQRKTAIGWQLWWNWEVDTQHYPGWEELVKELQLKGIQTMTYCNPLLASTAAKNNTKRNLLEEATAKGFLVKNASGESYMITNTNFDCAIVDLTNPAARTWLKGIMHDMVETGIRGWMADFGEALPFASHLFSGKNSTIMHNKFPEIWAELNREFVEEWENGRRSKKEKAATSGEESNTGHNSAEKNEQSGQKEQQDTNDNEDTLVFFMRAGYRASPRWATLFWEGDQMVSWQRHDGIKSAVVGLLSSGMSGYSLNHSDIGGYCTVDAPFLHYKRTEELLLRWMELNAFSVIFRTHEGNKPTANHQFYTNSTTLSFFARFAKVYKAWEFYRKKLVKEAATIGLPVVRHMFLHYPQDEYVQHITYEQFLVGSEILVVPVLDKGHKRVLAYFPYGDEWVHVWTGNTYKSPSKPGYKAWIKAPLGNPAVFVKKGTMVGTTFLDNLSSYDLI